MEIRKGEQDNLVDYFDDIREIMLERLLTESDEDDARWKYLLQTMERSRIAQNVILHLNQSFKDCVTTKDVIVSFWTVHIYSASIIITRLNEYEYKVINIVLRNLDSALWNFHPENEVKVVSNETEEKGKCL